MRGRRRRPREVDVAAALAWRDFMVSDYSDAGQERWLADKGVDLIRGTAGWPDRARSRSTGCATRPSTWCWRPAPPRCMPPIPACASWTACGPTARRPAMRAVPRRLLVLGGGPVGVEMAQAVRRLGGEVVLVATGRLLAREPAPLGDALGEVLRRDGIEMVLDVRAPAPRSATATTTSSILDDGRELRGDRLLVATGRRPRVDGHRAGDGRHPGRPARHPGRRAAARRRPAVGGRRRHRRVAAHPRGQVPGRGGRVEHPRPRTARPTTRRCPGWSTPTRKRPRWARPRPRSPPRPCRPRSPRPRPTPAPTPSPTAS